MGKYHAVEQGEYLSKIARRFGFSDYRTLWNDSHNQELKKRRQNPNILYAGDRLYIPDRQDKTVQCSSEKRHKFVLKQPTLMLRLVLKDLNQKPIRNTKCELIVAGNSYKLSTKSEGDIEQLIPATAEEATVIIRDPATPLNGVSIPVKIGHLDPIKEVSGQKARLNNLGYGAGPLESTSDEENQRLFLSAVEEFQCDHGLTVDGKCGAVTQAKLQNVHGC